MHTFRMDSGSKCYMQIFLLIITICEVKAYDCERLKGISDSCYIFIRKPLPWQEAVFDCTNRKYGHMVSLDTEKEAEVIRRKLLKGHGHLVYYVGGITTNNHKSWFWYKNGVELSSTLGNGLWEKGQPDNAGGRGENCAGFDFRPGHSGGIADFSCDQRHGYICEVPTPDYGDYYGLELDEKDVNVPVG